MRYSRQEVFLGKKQAKLGRTKVLVIGCGALGSTAANILARAGISLRLVDRDLVELSNLHRASLLTEQDVGKPKTQALKERLSRINSSIKVEAVFEDFNPFNAEKLVKGCSIVVDGTDNMDTRYVINDVCLKTGKPFVFGSAIRTEGMTATFLPSGPCFLCVFPKKPKPGTLETCHSAGVLGTITTLIASIQANEVIKILTETKPNLDLIHVDLSKNLFETIKITKNKSCESCVKKRYNSLQAEDIIALKTCDGFQITPRKARIDLRKLARQFRGKTTPLYVTFKFQGFDITVFKNGRMSVNTSKESVARSLFAKVVGL